MAGSISSLTTGILKAGNDAQTVMLLHCDGANSSTSFPDSSQANNTVTAAGTGAVKTANSPRFGGAAFDSSGTGGWLSFPTASGNFTWAGDFTVDFWLRAVSIPGAVSSRIVAMRTNSGFSTDFQLVIDSADANKLKIFDGTGYIANISSASILDSTWHHVAITRSGTSTRTFLDGALITTVTNSVTWAPGATAYIASYDGTATYATVCQIDEFRISKGAARWIAAFTSPGEPYS